MSWLAFTNQANSDFNGPLSWIKPADAKARYYSGGFTNECNIVGSAYLAPATTTNHVLNLLNAQVMFLGGDLSSNFTNSVAIGPGDRVANLSSNRLSLSFSRSSGTFIGKAIDPWTGKALPFKGAVFQKVDSGCGFLLGTNQSSRVAITQ